MRKTFTLLFGLIASFGAAVMACEGNSTSASDLSQDGGTTNDGGTTPASTFAIGGSVTGLAGTGLMLQNNAGDDLDVAANGTFVFPTKLAAGKSFDITVKSQPTAPSQTCKVTGGTGTVASGDVATVVVNCATDTLTVGGTVSGLAGTGLVLQNNAGNDISVGANGSFAFPTALASGSAYAVAVKTQPTAPSQTCTVTGGSGSVATANVTDVTVSCVTDKFTVGGSLNGLAAGNTVVLQNNGTDDLSITKDGSFVFATPVQIGQSYAVTVKSHPTNPRQRCTVANDSGTVADADVTDVDVSCADVYTVGGTITGLTSAGLVLTNGGGAELVVPRGATSFTLPTPLTSGSSYAIAVKTHPAGMACVVAKDSGTVGKEDVTSVAVTCAPHSSYCQTVNGIRWCRDPLEMRSCNTFCSSLGFGNPTISNTEWLMAQDTDAECGQLAAAFGVSQYSVYTYGYGCAEIQNGRLMCSTYAECPQRHRTGSDSTVNAVCPCQ